MFLEEEAQDEEAPDERDRARLRQLEAEVATLRRELAAKARSLGDCGMLNPIKWLSTCCIHYEHARNHGWNRCSHAQSSVCWSEHQPTC